VKYSDVVLFRLVSISWLNASSSFFLFFLVSHVFYVYLVFLLFFFFLLLFHLYTMPVLLDQHR